MQFRREDIPSSIDHALPEKFEIAIAEHCPIPAIGIDDVPGDVFMQLCDAYSDWKDGAISREIARLQALGHLPSDVERWQITVIEGASGPDSGREVEVC